MKAILFTIITSAVLMMSVTAKAAIPATYSVTPEPGSTVTEISVITVTSTVDDYFSLYTNSKLIIDGENVEYSANVSGVSDNLLTYTLKSPVVAEGEHTITIPAASFSYGDWGIDDNEEISFTVTIGKQLPEEPKPGEDPEPDPAVIPVTFEVIPEAGSEVDAITEITIKSTEYDYLVANKSKKLLIDGEEVETTATTSGPLKNLLTYTLVTPVADAGKHLIVIPKAAFSYEDDWGDSDSDEFRFTLVVKENDTPVEEPDETVIPATFQIIPEAGSEIESITEITVKSTEFDYLRANASVMLRIDGIDVETTAAASGALGNLLTYTLATPVTESGKHRVVIPRNAFTYEDDWDECYSDEFRFTLIVKSNIQSSSDLIDNDSSPATFTIYSLTGVALIENATESDFNRLPAGIYIANGKKVIVK